jgi:hypothetical protein
MGHACTHDPVPGPDKEHPVVAILAIIAIVAAILLIGWVRLAVHGTEDLEEALVEPFASSEEAAEPREPRLDTRLSEDHEVDAAVTSSRFATGFSQ